MAAVASSGSAVVKLPSDTQILVTREFAAPPHLVYRALTEPDLIARWWHANRGTIESVEVDLHVGGTWRYVSVTESGFVVGFHGEFREIVPNERIVCTEVYEGVPAPAPGEEAVNTYTLEPTDSGTRLVCLTQLASRADRDMIIDSGMEAGMQDAYDLLEGVAIGLA